MSRHRARRRARHGGGRRGSLPSGGVRVGSVGAVVAVIVGVVGGCAADPPAAVVGLSVTACGPGIESGSGAFIAPDLVLTAAHVVAGASSITLHRTGLDDVEGRVVAFDPRTDLALVAVSDQLGRRFERSTRAPVAGDTGTAYVVRDGAVTALPVTVARPIIIRTDDIYLERDTERAGYELVADVRRGDSGGAVVIHGKVVGVIWARSNAASNRGYAVDITTGAALIDEQRAAGRITTDQTGTPIDPTRCA